MIGPGFFIILGLIILIIDLHTINFITPIALGIITFGLLGYTSINVYYNVFISIIVTIVTYYPFFKFVRSTTKAKQATPEDELIGATGKVIQKVDDEKYKVEVNGQVFYALSSEELKEGDKIVVKNLDSIKLIVEKAN